MATKKAHVHDREYVAVLDDVAALLVASRTTAARAVNSLMTSTYWLIGRRIVEGEQQGRGRARYGEWLIERLALALTARFGRGFGHRNLEQMRAVFLARREIVQTASAELAHGGNAQTGLRNWSARSPKSFRSRGRTTFDSSQ
ncbi:MAG: DUF1016 N-terminal domain-containing protein [Myxococcaceae bacterium]